MVTTQRLLHERDRLLRRLARLETRRALGVDRTHAGTGSPWSFHRAARPSPRCVTTYVQAVVRALPALAWSEADRGRRERLLPELHDAYADEDLERLRALRDHAADRPREEVPLDVLCRKLQLHVAWLVDRVATLRDHDAGATGPP